MRGATLLAASLPEVNPHMLAVHGMEYRFDMRKRIRLAIQQLDYARRDVALAVNTRPWRWYTVVLSDGFWAIVLYRVDRGLYLLLGNAWVAARAVLLPVGFFLRPWFRANCDIHYRADIGPGLKILHPSLGVVISGYSIVGKRLTLTGGNCIGGRHRLNLGDLRIGDDVTLGANAVVLGPAIVGDNVSIGAGAVVVKDAPDGSILTGVPANSRPSRAALGQVPHP